MSSILLRFRDTIDGIDTIKEHTDLIDNKGYTWWGWWKKTNEPNNTSEISIFQKNVQNNNVSIIGLFDRNTSRFFSAQICEVKANLKSKIDSPDKRLTPKYYNDVKLHCWFKLCLISQITEAEFKNLFSIVPTKEETLYCLPYSEEAEIQRKIIESNVILHLSDLHFGEDFGFPSSTSVAGVSLIDRFKSYFELENKVKIGLVIVSGDITSRANMGVLQGPAIEFLNKLCEVLNIKKDQLVIVPGNHDIPIKDANYFASNHENSYKLFLKELYGERKEMFGYDKFITTDGLKIDILRINSSRLRNKTEMNYGYVGWDDYRYLILENIEEEAPTIKIAVLHHHLVSVSSEESFDVEYKYGNVSVTIDAGKVIDGLQHNNFNLVLHGHQHLPSINKVSRGIKNGSTVKLDKGLFLLGAGSAGAKIDRLTGEFRDNSFSLIYIENEKITVESVQYNSTKEPSIYFDSQIEIVR
jgi:predicted phosphodiesterase